MKSKEFIIETLTNPYPMNVNQNVEWPGDSKSGWRADFGTENGDDYNIIGIYNGRTSEEQREFKAYIERRRENAKKQGKQLIIPRRSGLPKGGIWEVHFNRILNKGKEDEEEQLEITGTGDAFRVFATVFEFIKKIVAKQSPEQILIKASMYEPGRGNLYAKLVRKYASSLGYERTGATIKREENMEKFIMIISKVK